MPLTLTRQPETRPDQQFYYVLRSGERVGRIYNHADTLPPGATHPWFWTIEFPHFRGSDAIHYGNAKTKEEAMAAFKARWLLSHPGDRE